MPIDITTTRLAAYTVFMVSGDATATDFLALIERVQGEYRDHGVKRVLVNLLGVDESLKFTDEFSLGEQVARTLGDMEMIASVVRAGRRTGTSERVARAKKMQLRVFESQDEAQAWLVAGPVPEN